MASRGLWHFMSARTRRSLALSWSALFVLSLLLQYFSFAVASPVAAAAGDPVVTLEDGVNGCNGVRPTPGSENTNKRLIGGSLIPGGTATFQISYPVDPADVAGRTTFVITDCVFVDGTARLKYSVSFVPNTVDYVLTFSLVIPVGTPVGAEYCNYAKTTAAPSQSQASNRKAGPACFTVGGNISVLKVNEQGDPLAGATFHIVCTLPTTTAFLPNTIINGESIASSSGATITRDKTTGADGRIVIQAPVGTSCVITETAAPAGYEIAADPSVTLVASADGATHTFVNTIPKTKPTLSTQVRDGSGPISTADVGDVVTDRATLGETGGNGAVTGLVDFFVCFNASSAVECTAANATSVSAGANKTISGGIANSDGVTLSAAGFYCFRAEYDPNGNPKYLATSHSNTTTECVQALAGDLVITKVADAASVDAGDTIGYVITLTNNGTGTAHGVKVSDTVPTNSGLNWSIDAANTTGTWTLSGGTLSFGGATGVDLAAGASVHVHLTSPTTSATCGTINNSALVTSTNDGNPTVGPVAIVVNCPDLNTVKLVATNGGAFGPTSTAQPGDTLNYQIVVSNTGPGKATDVAVSDDISAILAHATYNADCSNACGFASETLTWTIPEILSGGSVTLTFSVTLDDTFPAGTTHLPNVVVVIGPGSNCAAGSVSADCDTDTTVQAAPVLNLVKEVSVNDGTFSHSGSANPGDTLTYRLTITNTGDAAATGESVTDNLANVLAHATWNDDASASSGTTSFVDPNLTWSGISIGANGGTAILTFSVTLDASGWAAGTTDLLNTAVEANSENCPTATSANPDCSTDTTVTTGTDLAITKSVEPSSIVGGVMTSVAYTIVVSNNGSGDTNGNVLVTDNDFPAFYTITGVVCAPTNGTCDAAHLTGTGIDLGILAANSSVTITVDGSAAPNNTTDVGPHTNTVAACEQVVEGQAICVHASAVLTVTLSALPAINVVKSASATSLPFPGGPVTYTYAVTNTGNVPLSNVTLTDDKCATVVFLGGDTNDDSKLDLTETWSYSCTMSISETTTNVATATGHFGDTTVQDTDTKTVAVGPSSSLTIDKSVTGNTGGTDPDLGVPAANVGDTLTYSLHYTGDGPLTNAVITDVLPQGLAFVAGSAHGNADFGDGVYVSATRTITWLATGVLSDPADGNLTYQVKVLTTAPDFQQPLVNLATIDSAETGPDSDTASVSVLAPPLELTPPPTDTFTPETAPSNPGFTLMLVLLGMAGLALGIGFVTPAPVRVRRRNRLG